MVPTCLRRSPDAMSSEIFAFGKKSLTSRAISAIRFQFWAIFLGVTFVNSALWACPFCSGPTETLGERYANSESVLITKCVAESPDPAARLEASGDYEIVSVLRDKSGKHKVGQVVKHDRTALPGTRTLFLGKMTESETGTALAWTEIIEVNDAVLKYIREAPSQKQSDRLKYFAKFLEHPEITIANDAYGEFANAKYEDIRPIARTMSPAKLRDWLENPKTPENRFGLFGMLLGMCGSEADAVVLEKWVLRTEDEVTMGVDGMAYGYLLIRGEAGLEKFERELLHNRQVSAGVIMDRMLAIRCLWTYGEGRISRERLCQSLHPLLQRPLLAQSVITDLARWKDWRIQSQVVALDRTPNFTRRTQRLDIVRYLQESVKDVPANSTDLPEHAVAAIQHLECLRQSDPALFVPPSAIPLRRSDAFAPSAVAEKPGTVTK